MIRYDCDAAVVREQVGKIDPKWLQKAHKRTAAIIQAAVYAEKSSIWSTVKEVFMQVQMNKCAFCERQFETPDYGKIEFDLEHFRPKSSVMAWPDPTRHADIRYDFDTGPDSPTGYYWLAYDLANYAASCKVCNTTFKSNHFPVSTPRLSSPADATHTEQADLCHPLDPQDEDPEHLVSFVATTAVPAHQAGPLHRRGRVIIDFFGLNARLQLHRERARMISLFGGALAARHGGRASASDLALLAKLPSPALPHASCLRAFEKTWDQAPDLAVRIFEACRTYAVDDASAAPPGF